MYNVSPTIGLNTKVILAKISKKIKSKQNPIWCLYCTKLAPIFKIADVPRAERVAALTKIVRSTNTPPLASANADEAKQNYFCGRKRICFASAFCIRRAGGRGRNARRIFDYLNSCVKAEVMLKYEK